MSIGRGAPRACRAVLDCALSTDLETAKVVQYPEVTCEQIPSGTAASLVKDLARALQQCSITTVFQPIVAFADGRLYGFEALARWDHAIHGAIPPAVFVDLAERTGLIGELGQIVLDQGLLIASHWPDEVVLSVNLSVAQLSNRQLPWEIRMALECAAVAPHLLQLELTETLRLEEVHVEVLIHLREQGIRIALDDFGKGHSTLDTIHALPFDSIKLDRSFAKRATHDRCSQAIVKELVELAKSMNATVVAEGIETVEEWQLMALAGCDFAQGFLISSPINASTGAWEKSRHASSDA